MGPTNHGQLPLERIKDEVPHYEGYKEAKARRKSDELLRTYLQRRLTALAEELSRCSDRTRVEYQAVIGDNLSKIEQKLLTIADSLGNPIYTDSQFFESTDLSSELLRSLYSYELIMFAEASHLSEEISDLIGDNNQNTDAKERIIRIDDAIDSFNQALFERELLLEGGSAEN